jgi:hypothetical protein
MALCKRFVIATAEEEKKKEKKTHAGEAFS